MIEANPRYASAIAQECHDAAADIEVYNCAISDYDGDIEMITSKTEGMPDWVRGISHISSKNHKGARLLENEKNLKFAGEKITVPCMTLDSFIEQAEIDHLDLLKVDVEGHEMNIFGDYSWNLKPSLVKVEHSHIDEKPLVEILSREGYLVWVERNDIYGVLK